MLVSDRCCDHFSLLLITQYGTSSTKNYSTTRYFELRQCDCMWLIAFANGTSPSSSPLPYSNSFEREGREELLRTATSTMRALPARGSRPIMRREERAKGRNGKKARLKTLLRVLHDAPYFVFLYTRSQKGRSKLVKFPSYNNRATSSK
jgi:hypothetical protein